MNKVIVAGSRSITDEVWVHGHLDRILAQLEVDEVVSGTCRGPDKFGESWAARNATTVKTFPANWNKYGRKAGFLRNQEMANYGTHLVAFLADGSRGTKMMIECARKAGLQIRIITPPTTDRS